MATATGTGLKPAAMAAVMPKGPTMLVAAVWDVSSDMRRDMTANTAMRATSDGLPPRASMMSVPNHVDKPVAYIIVPIDRPPPKRRRVPHSMPLAASFHDRVNCRSLKLTGRRNKASAPMRAATASGNRRLYSLIIGLPGSRTMLMMPGVTQRTMATIKAISVFFWARVHFPSSWRRAAMNSSAPAISETSSGYMRARTT